MVFELKALALAFSYSRLTPESCFINDLHQYLTDTSQNELGEICSLGLLFVGHIFVSITFKLVAEEVQVSLTE